MPRPIDETVVIIGPPGAELVGVLARPADPAAAKPLGVVIVVGGPQTRVGSHRQFVLMARALAATGHPCLRFDYTGMGDSPGPRPDFEHAGPDLRRACDALATQAGCAKLALWGLCDGATAALFYAPGDERVAAVIAANPWARSDATRSAALVSEHYGSRLRSAEFWKKLLTGRIDVLGAAREAVGHLLRARGGARDPDSGSGQREDLPIRLARTIATWGGSLRLQLSGHDLTAAEFEIGMSRSGLPRDRETGALRIEDADHTFSDPRHWDAAIADLMDVLARL